MAARAVDGAKEDLVHHRRVLLHGELVVGALFLLTVNNRVVGFVSSVEHFCFGASVIASHWSA